MSKRINWSFDGTNVWRVYLNAVTTAQLTEDQCKKLDDVTYGSTAYYGQLGTDEPAGFAFNFPALVQIEKVGLQCESSKSFVVEVSNNTTNGIDGDWTEVLGAANTLGAYEYGEYAVSPISAQWLRIIFPGGDRYLYYRNIHLFGEYDTPRFEFYDENGLEELTANYPLLMANAPNFEDYHGTHGFRLKNTDTEAHSYALVLAAVKYGGDTVVSSNFTLSQDGGETKNGSLAINNLAPDEMSDVIGVYGDVLIADNPADGYHWFVIQVQETA